MVQPKSRSLGRKISIWVFRVLIFQFILINISAAFHAQKVTHYYDSDRVRTLESSQGKILLRTWRLMVGRKLPKSQVPYYPPFQYETIRLKTKKQIDIEAWHAKADSSAGTVIMFHGLNSNKGNHISEAISFLNMNYNVFMVDMRAHGNSGGELSSLGYRESEEVKIAYDYIREQGEKNIVLWGMSLGAVVIAKAAYDYDLSPEKIIMEMPFDRLQDHLRARARVLGFPDEPFGFFVTFWTGIEGGYWGYDHNTSRYVRKIKCPVLLQWGAMDQYVLAGETKNIFTNLPAATGKKLVVYENAQHERLHGADEHKWEASVREFLIGDTPTPVNAL